MPYVTVGDVRIHYHIFGCGEPLILIGGFCGDISSWNHAVPLLEGQYKLITFDNRGSGLTAYDGPEFKMEDMADDVAGLMTGLGIGRAHVLGWSMGGNIAQELSLRYPDKVAGLVLMSTYSKVPERSRFAIDMMIRAVREGASIDTFSQMLRSWCSADRTITAEEHASKWTAEPNMSSRRSIDGFALQKNAVDCFCSMGKLDQVRSPTLVIHGEDDIMVPIEFGKELAANIHGAELVSIPGAGHVLPPSVYSHKVLGFLARHPLSDDKAP